jgi:rubredoxin
MTDWIAWTKCRTCGFTSKNVFETVGDEPEGDGTPSVRCPQCGNPAGYITFPAFEIETIEVAPPGDPSMYDTIDDW